jgi:RNA polymerase primary sigma factor
VSVEHEELIAEIQKRTTSKEFNIICLYFGLIDGHEYTLEEIGRNYDVTRERIRQLLEKGLKKIRISSFVKEYDGILEAYEQ